MHETQALVDTGAIRTVLAREIVEKLGLRIRGQQMAKYADGRQEAIGLTKAMGYKPRPKGAAFLL
ncbi:hypothetical protein NIES4073_77360 [Kalymmatonema gypsitolerans NIES-4073]|nr:hypothetical protein NIES4073_77360 [Scytonema sp. NIES-4073]